VYIFLFIFSHKSGLGNKRDVHVANWKREKKKHIHINPNPYKH